MYHACVCERVEVRLDLLGLAEPERKYMGARPSAPYFENPKLGDLCLPPNKKTRAAAAGRRKDTAQC